MSRSPYRFADRIAAGRELAEELRRQGIDPDIVLAIPRGALPLGRAVADAFEVPLDIVAAQKIGAPNNPEFAIGAVADDGTAWLNESVIERNGIDSEYVEREREREAEAAREKIRRYRDAGDIPDLTGKTVVIVDDGIATGATARACIERVRTGNPGRVILAAPVGSPRSVAELEEEVDTLICLHTPEQFRAVGQFYERFDQVSDEEAIGYLRED